MKCLKRNMLVVGLVTHQFCNGLERVGDIAKVLHEDRDTYFSLLPREVLQLMILGVTHLHMACSEGAEERVESYLKQGFDKNALDIFGRTPVYMACQNGHRRIVKLLLDKRAHFGETTHEVSPFVAACTYGHSDVLELLLERRKRGKISWERKLWIEALRGASENGHRQVVELLLSCKSLYTMPRSSVPSVPSIDSSVFMLLCSIAARNGHGEVLRLFLEADHYILSTAAVLGKLEILRLLLDAGIDKDLDPSNSGTALFHAARLGKVAAVGLLLEAGADCNKSNPLFAAAKSGYVDVVRLLLAAGADCNRASDNKPTPLYAAADGGHTDIVRLLLDAGACLDIADKSGERVLVAAVKNGYDEIVKVLINAVLDREKEGTYTMYSKCDGELKSSVAPVYVAFSYAHVEVVKLFLGSAAETTIRRSTHILQSLGRSEMHRLNGHDELIRLFLDVAASRNNMNELGYATRLLIAALAGDDKETQSLLTFGHKRMVRAGHETSYDHLSLPLFLAAAYGHVAVVNLLLEAGASADSTDYFERETALTVAALNGHAAVVKVLLHAGADRAKFFGKFGAFDDRICSYDFYDLPAYSLLMVLAYHGQIEVVRVLLDFNAAEDNDGIAGAIALWLAAKKGHTEIVRMLLEVGVDKEYRNYCWRALVAAARFGHKDVVQLLLEAEVDKEGGEESDYNYTPLHWAAEKGHVEIMRMLLDAGAEKDSFRRRCKNGTPLYVAALKNQIDSVNLLLSVGADVNKANELEFGRTLLHKAVSDCAIWAMKILLAAGADKNKADDRGETPLTLAIKEEYTEGVSALLSDVVNEMANEQEKNAAFTSSGTLESPETSNIPQTGSNSAMRTALKAELTEHSAKRLRSSSKRSSG